MKTNIEETFKQIMTLLDVLAVQEAKEGSRERSDAVLRKIGLIKAKVAMVPRPDRDMEAVPDVKQPFDTVQNLMRQESAKQKSLSYLEGVVSDSAEEMRELVEELDTMEKAVLLHEVLGGLGLISHVKGMYHALKSMIILLPIFSELLQRVDHVSETVEILNNLMQHRNELERLATSVPQIEKILKDVNKFMPFASERAVSHE